MTSAQTHTHMLSLSPIHTNAPLSASLTSNVYSCVQPQPVVPLWRTVNVSPFHSHLSDPVHSRLARVNVCGTWLGTHSVGVCGCAWTTVNTQIQFVHLAQLWCYSNSWLVYISLNGWNSSARFQRPIIGSDLLYIFCLFSINERKRILPICIDCPRQETQ